MKNPIILKRMDFFNNIDDNEESSLLQTIRVPKNLLFLTDKLPQPNYERIPNKRNLSFTNNKTDLPDIHGKNINKSKKSKKSKEIQKENKKEYSEKKDTKDKHSIQPNNEEIVIKKMEKIDEDQDDIKKKRITASLNQSHLSGGKIDNSSINHNIKIIKGSDLDINTSVVREKSPINEEKRKIKEANNMLPNIKGQAIAEYIKYDDNRSARNKYFFLSFNL